MQKTGGGTLLGLDLTVSGAEVYISEVPTQQHIYDIEVYNQG